MIRNIIRGCGTLPHVGDHPGTGTYIVLIGMGMAAGINGGPVAVIGGGVFMAVGMGLVYFWGAYDRAITSDRIDARETRNGNR